MAVLTLQSTLTYRLSSCKPGGIRRADCSKPLGKPLDISDREDLVTWQHHPTQTRRPNVYAVVTLIPHLDNLRGTSWYRSHMEDLPLLGKR